MKQNNKQTTNQNYKKPVKENTNSQHKEDANKNQSVSKGNPGNTNFISEAIKHISDPVPAAEARVKLAQSSAIDTMCHVIEHDSKLTIDEKLERLRSVNDIESNNKEQAHRMAAEFTWQDGLLVLGLGGLLFGLGWLGHSKGLNLLKLVA